MKVTQKAPKRSPIPEMSVACNSCTYMQKVPGNTQIFICCMCNNMTECVPLYGLFVCGKCQCQVCYPYGTSTMIRCTKCSTVNQVPLEPKKKYLNEEQKLK